MREGHGMRVQQLVWFVLALTMGGIAAHPALSEENRGTPEQQMACTPDVWRLCGSAIPDVERIKACLRANVPQLSPPCRAVFEPTGTVEPRRRARRPPPPRQPYQPYPAYPAYPEEEE
jgi:hypothetical protein